MRDDPVVSFLQWALPKLGKEWSGFKSVRGQVESRVVERLTELSLRSFAAYRDYLVAHPSEWSRLDSYCRITISRFYRDPAVFDALAREVLPDLAKQRRAQGGPRLHALVLGAASGEEPYTLRILWRHVLRDRFSMLPFHVTATEAQPHMLQRAGHACYSAGSVRQLPNQWIERAFRFDNARAGGKHAEPYCLRPLYRRRITWRLEDIRTTIPDGPFSVILCRNLVFTYFQPSLQRWILDRLLHRLRPRGVLLLGADESLPDGDWPLRPGTLPGEFHHRPSPDAADSRTGQ